MLTLSLPLMRVTLARSCSPTPDEALRKAKFLVRKQRCALLFLRIARAHSG